MDANLNAYLDWLDSVDPNFDAPPPDEDQLTRLDQMAEACGLPLECVTAAVQATHDFYQVA